MTFQRIVQTLSFFCFIILLLLASFPLIPLIPVDAFLKLDPLVFLGASLSSRAFVPFVWTAVLLLVLTIVVGRFFCGVLCPMGTTIDVTDRLFKKKDTNRRKTIPAVLKSFKYQFLFFTLGAALLGVSLIFLGSALSLITRFYGLIIYPILCFLGEKTLLVLRPLADHFDITSIAYAHVFTPRFDLQWFTAIFFIAIFAMVVYSPRFWCRYLCPSGAVFALISWKPLVRRHVSDECNHCGLCQKDCPMEAIGDDPFVTDHRECIVCQTCVRICPTGAVRFSGIGFVRERPCPTLFVERRNIIKAGASGMGAALVTLTSLKYLPIDTGPGIIIHPELIRPPGALPETDFLARCIRCGECMKVCPTNTLQPIGLVAGFYAFFSPKITPRRGPCEPSCNACGQVCPTGAIRALSLNEKLWAKVGTAHIFRQKCLAWEFGKKCLICDEFCPYNAVEFKMVPEIPIAVPYVNETRCSGCGFCEYHCPIQAKAAIVVEPMGSLRLNSGSFRKKGFEIGLSLDVKQDKDDGTASHQWDSFTSGETGLPPGFSK